MQSIKVLYSVAAILHILAEKESLHMFNTIAKRKQIRSKTLRSLNNLTTKQYYTRLEKLIKLGLVKGKSGIIMITSFGEVVYDAKMKIDSAINRLWQLKAVDSLQTSNEINEDTRKEIINNIVDDKSIRTTLMNVS